jgi:hypothetical protein
MPASNLPFWHPQQRITLSPYPAKHHPLHFPSPSHPQYYRFRDRAALIMLVAPALLAAGMARVEVLRSTSASSPLSPPSSSSTSLLGWGVAGEGLLGNAGMLSFAPGLMTGVQLYLSWLAYFYLAMSMRENVLMVRGES